jgi:hypothetical protein
VLEPYRGSRVIECPLCGLPHRKGAVVCDGCGQRLDRRLDLDELRHEYRRRKWTRFVAAACVLGALWFNLVWLRGGVLIVVVAPIGWFGWNEVRIRHLRRALERARKSRREALTTRWP